MSQPSHLAATPTDHESIDVRKLKFILYNNRIWIIVIVVITNLTAYFIMRWKKDGYISEAEMKLDIKQDVINIGSNVAIDPPNMQVVAGEIEQIKSKVFLNLVIDSLRLDISYFNEEHLLKDEEYGQSPITVVAENMPDYLKDIPIYFKPVGTRAYLIEASSKQGRISAKGRFGDTIRLQGLKLTINKTSHYNTFPDNDFYFTLNSRKNLFDYFSKNLLVEPLNIDASTIRVTLQDYNAVKAHSILNVITSFYIKYRNTQRNLSTKQKIEWLSDELARIEDTLKSFDNYFERHLLRNKSSDIHDDVKQITFQLNKLDSQQIDVERNIEKVNILISQLSKENSFSLLYPTSFLPPYLNKRIEVLQNLIQQQKRVELSYKKHTRTFKQKEDELNTIKAQITYQIQETKKKWEADVAEINRKRMLLEKRFLDIPKRNTLFSKNKRLYTLYESFYLSVIKSRAQFEITQAGNTPNFKILSPATLPDKPTVPIRAMIMGGGVLASLILGALLVGILYLLYDKIISNQAIEEIISAPILGSIPEPPAPLPTAWIVKEKPKSTISEAIRTLRTSLDFFLGSNPNKSIAVSSTIPGEGKSFLALNLSIALAFSGKKVVLVNLDMRKENDNELVTPPDPKKGISTLLIQKYGWKECVLNTGVENMNYIPAGPNPPNPSELLLGEGFTQLLNDLKKEYEFVILDTPPAGLVTDGIIAMKKSDASIYLFKINYSKKSFLEIFNGMIKINRIENIAVVTNGLPVSKLSYYSYYYERMAAATRRHG